MEPRLGARPRSRVSLAGPRSALPPAPPVSCSRMAAGGSHEDKHRAYLQQLQERNQMHRQMKEEEDQKQSDAMRREQGFSVCFSGANAAKRTSRSSSARGQRDAPRFEVRGDLFGGGGSGNGGNGNAGGVWKRWEEHTVEIKGQAGEVYAVRPTGERKVKPPVLPQGVQRSASLGATERELPALREKLLADGLILEEHDEKDDNDKSISGLTVALDFGKVVDLSSAAAALGSDDSETADLGKRLRGGIQEDGSCQQGKTNSDVGSHTTGNLGKAIKENRDSGRPATAPTAANPDPELEELASVDWNLRIRRLGIEGRRAMLQALKLEEVKGLERNINLVDISEVTPRASEGQMQEGHYTSDQFCSPGSDTLRSESGDDTEEERRESPSRLKPVNVDNHVAESEEEVEELLETGTDTEEGQLHAQTIPDQSLTSIQEQSSLHPDDAASSRGGLDPNLQNLTGGG